MSEGEEANVESQRAGVECSRICFLDQVYLSGQPSRV